MKKIIAIADIILMAVTLAVMVYLNCTESTGLAALEDAGRFAVCLICLGAEIVVLLAIWMMSLYKKNKQKSEKENG